MTQQDENSVSTLADETQSDIAPATTSESTDAPAKPKREKKAKEPKAPKPPRVKKERPVRTTPAHMSKVDKVASQLPALSGNAQRPSNTHHWEDTARKQLVSLGSTQAKHRRRFGRSK